MKRILTITSCAVATAFFIALLTIAFTTPFDDRQFEKTEWANSEPKIRGLMFRDLSGKLEGLSEPKVIALLGQPDEILRKGSYTPKKGFSGDDVYSYYIGSWPWRGMEHAFICVTFDVNGIVINITIQST